MLVQIYKSLFLTVALIISFGTLIVQAETIQNKKFSLKFDVNGKPKSLFRFADKKELIYSAKPGDGFYLIGANSKRIAFKSMKYFNNQLIVKNGSAKLTFDVNVQNSYISFSLKRVEGIPTKGALALRFEMNVVDNIALHPLDHMTYQRNCFGSTDRKPYSQDPINKVMVTREVLWNWLWDRNPDNPFGGFALQCPQNNAEHDDNLIEVWVNEKTLPKPAIMEKWTVQRAAKWYKGWLKFSNDIRRITIHGESLEELIYLADFAKKEELNRIKLFTHTWRGDYMPATHHLAINSKIFPNGESDFKKFTDYLSLNNMQLDLHTVSMSISDNDKTLLRGPNGPDPRLAHWFKGKLVKPFRKGDRELYVRPAPGYEMPMKVGIGPGTYPGFFNLSTISIGSEFCSAYEVANTDKEIWTFKVHTYRGHLNSKEVDHVVGAEVTGYLRPYSQCFTANNNTNLIDELANGYGNFCNNHGVDHIELDGLEVRAVDGYGEAKFGLLLYQALDHYTTSGSSTGGPMPFHIEYWFKETHSKGSSSTSVGMPISLERTGRRATNPYEVHVAVARHVALGSGVGGLTKPQPMFDLTKEMLDTHGLSDRFVKQLRLWRQISGNLSEKQKDVITKSYVGTYLHPKTEVVYKPQMVNGQLEILPMSLLSRPGVDSGWGTGQEFGPICVWQFVKVGEKVTVENRFDSQEPEFVIHVMPALVNKRISSAGITSGKIDKVTEGYDIGAGLEKSLTIKGLAKDLILQPELKQILNKGDHEFSSTKDGLEISYHNERGTLYTERKNLPHWVTKANSNNARGVGLTVSGDGSGAILLIQLKGHGVADYIVPLDFKGKRDIVIPISIASWSDARWFWTMPVGHMAHEYPIAQVGLAMGRVPGNTKATATVSNLRLLAEEPAALINPTLNIGKGSLQIKGSIKSDQYIWYTGGNDVGVYDLNWNQVTRLPVVKRDFIATAKGQDMSYEVQSEGQGDKPQLGVQIFTSGKPMQITMGK